MALKGFFREGFSPDSFFLRFWRLRGLVASLLRCNSATVFNLAASRDVHSHAGSVSQVLAVHVFLQAVPLHGGILSIFHGGLRFCGVAAGAGRHWSDLDMILQSSTPGRSGPI